MQEEIPVRLALNEVLRDAYVEDNERGVRKWNKTLAEYGVDVKLTLPARRFNRRVGAYSSACFDVQGQPISKEEFETRKGDWLPSSNDTQLVKGLMSPVYTPGKMAGWVAPPSRGINAQPLDYEYVRL